MNQAFDQDRSPLAMDGAHPPASTNPYAGQPAPHLHDLDANAPQLRSADVQRLNRKALLFLAGIVALLIGSAFWLFSSASASGTEPRRREEKVEIPELPQLPAKPGEVATASLPVAPPLPSAAGTDMPPLPAQPIALAPPPMAGTNVAPQLRAATLVQRRTDNDASQALAGTDVDPYTQALLAGMPPPPAAAAQAPATPVRVDASSAQFLDNPDAMLVRGTYIRCVLETRIVTDIPGFTSCVVTEPVYSINGRSLLLAKGSKVSGRYDTDANGPRVAVVWDRITTPDGVDVRMSSPGVDNLGGAGHPGDYDAHWGSRMGAALLISLISDVFKYEGEVNGPNTTTISNGVVTQTPFESNTARTMQRLANQALDRSINRPATVTINQGTIVNIYVAKDVDFSAVLRHP
ncbi:MAG TPA: TrbI/VirB10 family protein [Luteimonas sp.]|jgi:type IV secretion system protein VirB10|nr:TrbI/VirB10 family protein [Luteimonas sp.]